MARTESVSFILGYRSMVLCKQFVCTVGLFRVVGTDLSYVLQGIRVERSRARCKGLVVVQTQGLCSPIVGNIDSRVDCFNWRHALLWCEEGH
jgi:hypothetical protein